MPYRHKGAIIAPIAGINPYYSHLSVHISYTSGARDSTSLLELPYVPMEMLLQVSLLQHLHENIQVSSLNIKNIKHKET